VTHDVGEARAPEPPADPPAPAPSAAPVAAPALTPAARTPAAVLALQRTVGNAAVTKILREPTATAPGQKTSRDNISAAAETIAEYFINAKSAPKREALLTTLLVNHDRAKELRDTYKSTWSRDLDATLAYGDLRPIDKVCIAMAQAGTDEALLFEGLGRCNANTIEADFKRYEFRGLAFDDNASSKPRRRSSASTSAPTSTTSSTTSSRRSTSASRASPQSVG
jgi:hypothetical protein